jgi:hypothetical protein
MFSYIRGCLTFFFVHILFTCVFVFYLCLISTSHAREPCLSRNTQNSVCSRFEFGYFSGVLKNLFILSKHGTKANIRSTKMANNQHAYNRMSFKAIGRQMGYHYTVVSRLVRKYTQTNNVKDLPRSGRPRVTSDRDDRTLQRLVRRMPFATRTMLTENELIF